MKKNNKLYRIISICLLLCFVFAFSCSAASPDFYHFLSTPSLAGDDFTNHLIFALTSSVDLDFVGPFLVTSWSPWINFTLNYFSDFISFSYSLCVKIQSSSLLYKGIKGNSILPDFSNSY